MGGTTVEKAFEVHSITIEKLFSLQRVIEKLQSTQEKVSKHM
jgi:hypothetical protein